MLVAGGRDEHSNYLNTATIYNPATDTFDGVPSQLSAPRAQHRATLLDDGTVLISGGFTTGGSTLASADLFDPVANTFAAVGAMVVARGAHTATLLANAKVLLAGGTGAGLAPLASAELYNPASRSFTGTGSMAQARSGAAAVLLKDGRALVTGGGGAGMVLASAELYDPLSGKFSATANPMPEPHFMHAIALLHSGQALVAGGFAGQGPFFFLQTEAAATVFDPVTDAFAPAAPLNIARSTIGAEVLDDGRVFIPGGADFQGGQLADAELYAPGAIDISGGMHSERVDHRALVWAAAKS